MPAEDGPRGLTRAPQEKHHKRGAREARRPLGDPFFFLPLLFFGRFRGPCFGGSPQLFTSSLLEKSSPPSIGSCPSATC